MFLKVWGKKEENGMREWNFPFQIFPLSSHFSHSFMIAFFEVTFTFSIQSFASISLTWNRNKNTKNNKKKIKEKRKENSSWKTVAQKSSKAFLKSLF